MPVITFAGENLIAQQQQAGQNLIIDQIVFANINGLDDTLTPDRSEALPSAENIQLTSPITKDGMLTSNTVVYSTVLSSTQGTFDFNWMGLYSSAHNVLVAVAYVPVQSKIATLGPVIGNVITKNFAIEFSGAADVTGINISAESWQIDYTARLMSMDKIQRDMSKNIYGQSTFLNDAFKIKHDGSKYLLTSGQAILGGLGLEIFQDLEITPGALPQTVWLDVYQERSMVGVLNKFDVVFNDGTLKNDYTIGGVEHSLVRLGVINSSVDIVDERRIISANFSGMSSGGGTFTGDVSLLPGKKLDGEIYDGGNRVWHKGNHTPIKSHNNIAAAKADLTLVLGQRVVTDGFELVGDGGQGVYIVVPHDTGTADNGLYHDMDSGNQLKLIDTDIKPEQYGAIGDGVSNDTAMFSAIRSLGLTPVTSKGKIYLIDYSQPSDLLDVAGSGVVTNGYISLRVDLLVGSFDREDLTAPATGPYIRRQQSSTESLELFVDSAYTGVKDGSRNKPFSSMNEALSFVPKEIYHRIRIYIYDGVYIGADNIFNLYNYTVTPRSSAGLKIIGHTDNSPLYTDRSPESVVFGNESTALDGASNFVFGGNVCDAEETYFEGITFDGRLQNYSRFGFKECVFRTGIDGYGGGNEVIIDGHGGTTYLVNCHFENTVRAIYAQDMASIFIEGCTGSNISSYSLSGVRGSRIDVRFSENLIDAAVGLPASDDTSYVRVHGQILRPDLFKLGTGETGSQPWFELATGGTILAKQGIGGGKYTEPSPVEPDRFMFYMDADGHINVRINNGGENSTVRVANFS